MPFAEAEGSGTHDLLCCARIHWTKLGIVRSGISCLPEVWQTPVGARHNGLEQHLTTGLGFLRLDALRLVVRQAVLAWGEDHCRWDVARHVDGVMSRAGHNFPRRVAKLRGPPTHQIDTRGIERLGRDLEQRRKF